MTLFLTYISQEAFKDENQPIFAKEYIWCSTTSDMHVIEDFGAGKILFLPPLLFNCTERSQSRNLWAIAWLESRQWICNAV